MNKLNNKFKAVDFMRSIRDEMTKEYHEDKKIFMSKLKSQTNKFIKFSYSKTTKKKSFV